MIKVSIIVPVYNTKEYLEKCLDSLINQTLKDIEIIVVNDGSTDDSQSIIDKYLKKDKRIKSIIKKNGGLGDARNYGINEASGEYIGFVDSDDYVELTMFEKLYNKAKKENSDIVECNLYWVYPNETRLDTANYYNYKKDIMYNIRVMVCNKIFKRDVISKQNILFPVGIRYEDIVFTYKLLPYVKTISYIDEAFYYYIQRGSSLSNEQNSKVRDIFEGLDIVREYYKNMNLHKKYEKEIEYLNIKLLLGSSFLRILGIRNGKLRKEILVENWEYLNKNYPNWKKNEYLKNSKSLKNKYYRMLNKLFYMLSSLLFGIKERW